MYFHSLFIATIISFFIGTNGAPTPIADSANQTAAQSQQNLRGRHQMVADMILHDDDLDDFDVSAPSGGSAAAPSKNFQPPTLWDHGFVYYEISPDAYHYRSLIDKAIRTIQEQARCIVFIPRTDEENYVYIDLGSGCNSYVGMVGGKQELNLDYSCMDVGNIMHELMHVLGFYHEHSRPDRDQYLFIFEENIEPEKQDNFRKIARDRYRRVSEEFDFGSIMIYGEYAFSKNGRPSMQPREWTTTRMENPNTKTRLSKMDEYSLNIVYQCF